MCGIGGFSLTPESKIHPRQLANALLTALEDRGSMASGIAFHANDIHGVIKAAVPGSGLSLKGVPKNTTTAIVHTRLATHGSTRDNRNNHPVQSPSEDIALVHNGVIYNHHQVREKLDHKIKFDVDTAVIPALIEQHGGISELKQLDGDAAISWLSKNDHGILNLARLEHSPVCVVQVEDGSFIFASTEALMWRVLIQLNLMPIFMENLAEFVYLKVKDGVIFEYEQLEKPVHASYGYDYGHYRNLTSGNKNPKPVAWDMDGPLDWEDDEAWEDYNRAFFKDDTDTDSCSIPPSTHDAWYIAYRSWVNKSPAYVYYHADEYADYKNDLWLLQDESDSEYELVDYGAVTIGGELVSAGYLPSTPSEPDLDLF